MEKKDSAINLGLTERKDVPGVKGSEHDRVGPNQVPAKKKGKKVKVGGNNTTIK